MTIKMNIKTAIFALIELKGRSMSEKEIFEALEKRNPSITRQLISERLDWMRREGYVAGGSKFNGDKYDTTCVEDTDTGFDNLQDLLLGDNFEAAELVIPKRRYGMRTSIYPSFFCTSGTWENVAVHTIDPVDEPITERQIFAAVLKAIDERELDGLTTLEIENVEEDDEEDEEDGSCFH